MWTEYPKDKKRLLAHHNREEEGGLDGQRACLDGAQTLGEQVDIIREIRIGVGLWTRDLRPAPDSTSWRNGVDSYQGIARPQDRIRCRMRYFAAVPRDLLL
jgi:hypothetical protein